MAFLYPILERSQTMNLNENEKRMVYQLESTCQVAVLNDLVIALGAGLGIWGVINLLEGYGNDNPGANAHVR